MRACMYGSYVHACVRVCVRVRLKSNDKIFDNLKFFLSYIF